jgi:DNA-binding MarR family transcriptional regulator
MTTLTFHLKRAYLDAIAKVRPLAALHGLTPSRVDLLHAIDISPAPPAQADLRRALGVTSAALSEMIQSLELLGLVTRRPNKLDLRARIVELTPLGRARLRGALRDMLSDAA